MTGFEIKQKVDRNNAKLDTLIKPGDYVLNKEVFELIAEIKELQKQCVHHYENGMCVYCRRMEE